jgi:Bacterial capsule synthesis protein PGA_cap
MSKKLTYSIFVPSLIFAIIASFIYWNNKDTVVKTNSTQTVATKTQEEISPPKPKPVLTSITNKSLYMGNIFFGRYIDDWSVQSANPELSKIPNYQAKTSDPRDYSHPFSQLSTFAPEKYDTWLAGLECPVTDQFVDSETQDNTLNFTCLPGYIPEAARYFDVFTLANNHIDNMQQIKGFENTRKVLEASKIQYFGHYDNAAKADICEVIAVEASAKYSDSSLEKVKIPVAYCGYHNVFKLPLQDEIDTITEYAKYFPTVVMPHQGAEYMTKSDELKQDTYHKFIDAGADLVVGDHPHTTQETEYYKGKLIVYSLGNFIFDQQFNSKVTSAITLDSELTLTDNAIDLNSYLTAGEDCSKFKDNCLTKAKSTKLIKPKLIFKFDVIASDNSNKITKKAGPEVQDQMERVTGFKGLTIP